MGCKICGRTDDCGGITTNGDGYGDSKYVGITPPEWATYCWDCYKKDPTKIPDLTTKIDEAFVAYGFCGFLEAYVGRCRNERGKCPKHDSQKCWKCNAPAVKNCAETFTLVCGVPECAEHPHSEYHRQKANQEKMKLLAEVERLERAVETHPDEAIRVACKERADLLRSRAKIYGD